MVFINNYIFKYQCFHYLCSKVKKNDMAFFLMVYLLGGKRPITQYILKFFIPLIELKGGSIRIHI